MSAERPTSLSERELVAEVGRLEEQLRVLREVVDDARRTWPAYLDYPEIGRPSAEFDAFAGAMRELDRLRQQEQADAK